MKKKILKVPWGMLREGLAVQDWPSRWLARLAEAGLPGPDFILLAPTSDMRGFTNRLARFQDVQNAMRMILMSDPLKFSAEVALSYSLHSWRHLYNTAGRQLRMSKQDRTT